MPYTYEREARTPFSEAFTIEVDGEPIGRVDLHFTPAGAVQATLCVPTQFDDEDIEDLIADIDERLVLPADPTREDFVVSVWRGELAGIFSEEDEDEPAEDTNGASPLP